jgi:hypothetical protein
MVSDPKIYNPKIVDVDGVVKGLGYNTFRRRNLKAFPGELS